MLQKLESTNKKLIRLLQLVYLNFLWGILVVLGLGLFTFGPASYAMVSVIRKWLRSSGDFPLTQTYFHYFKENYKETLLISWLYFSVAFVLYVDLAYIQNWYLRVVILVISFFYVLSALYIFPIMAHYQWQGMFYKIKMAFLFGFSQLHYSLVLLLIIIGSYAIIIRLMPGMLTFMGSSFFFFAITWTAVQLFDRLKKKEVAIDKNTFSEGEQL